MIAIIRIHGRVGVKEHIKNTLDRLRLRKKYACIVVEEKPEVVGMIRKVRDYVAYGKIDEKTLEELKKKRGKKDKKFFSLHPPRGGIKSSKLHFPKGVLGDNGDKINELIRRMLWNDNQKTK